MAARSRWRPLSPSRKPCCPSGRFHGVDTVLGPEMKSTGEVMGIDSLFGTAYAKSQMAAYSGGLPTSGTVFVSVANRDKRSMIFPVKRLHDLGFEIAATAGTAEVLRRNGVPATVVRKHFEAASGDEPDTITRILDGSIDIIINTPYGVGARLDGYEIRSAAVTQRRAVHHDDSRSCVLQCKESKH